VYVGIPASIESMQSMMAILESGLLCTPTTAITAILVVMEALAGEELPVEVALEALL